jgi:hypothetical protein
MRAFWRGRQTTLAETLTATEGGEGKAETQTQTQTNEMKKHIESAASAFALILTALICIVQELMKGGGGTDAATPPQNKGGAKPKAPVDETPPEGDGDADDMLGGDTEPEPEVTIEQLRAAGQAALKAGKSDKMKAILKKHGAENLGGLDKDDYSTVLAALKKLA